MNTISPHALDGNTSFVYELVDPRDMSIFYVGITINLYERYKQHVTFEGTNARKHQRIQDILTSGHLPIMRTREQVDIEKALDREAYWIRYYLGQGIALLNIAGVPDPLKPRIKQYKAHEIELKQLFFRAYTERVVSAWRATDKEFDEFIKRYLDIMDDPRYPGWQSYQRRRFIAHALNNGISLEFCAPVEEDDSVFVKRG